jgi:hypothetical protein
MINVESYYVKKKQSLQKLASFWYLTSTSVMQIGAMTASLSDIARKALPKGILKQLHPQLCRGG